MMVIRKASSQTPPSASALETRPVLPGQMEQGEQGAEDEAGHQAREDADGE